MLVLYTKEGPLKYVVVRPGSEPNDTSHGYPTGYTLVADLQEATRFEDSTEVIRFLRSVPSEFGREPYLGVSLKLGLFEVELEHKPPIRLVRRL